MNKFITLALLVVFIPLHADSACLDRRIGTHAYFCSDGAAVCTQKPKQGEYSVPCTCPCWKYKTTKRCAYCGHRRDPSKNGHGSDTITYPTIKLPRNYKQRPAYYIPKRIKQP